MTKAALEANGVEVEWLRWWDDAQVGDIIHYFGRPGSLYIQQAHEKRRKVVLTDLLGMLGVRSGFARAAQRGLMTLVRASLPAEFYSRMGWDSYRQADACIALTPWERCLIKAMFGAPDDRIRVVPNGVEEVFFAAPAVTRGPWLVCTATITEVKRVVELAQAAVAAHTPLWVIGRAFDDHLDYPQEFFQFARENPEIIRYQGPVEDRAALARIYYEARGFVLLSRWETLSLSALEAAACGCPLLLGDLPWAHSVFREGASFCSVKGSTDQTAKALRRFYAAAPGLPAPSRPVRWSEVAGALCRIYEQVLTNS